MNMKDPIYTLQQALAQQKMHHKALLAAHAKFLQHQRVLIQGNHQFSGAISSPQTSPREQPQDGVIRMVSNKKLQKLALRGAVTFNVIAVCAAFVMGLGVTQNSFALIILFPIAVALGIGHDIFWQHLNESREKANLLDWPKQ
jgi:hypothetical protein